MLKLLLLIISCAAFTLNSFEALADNGSPIYSPPPQSLDPGNAGAPTLDGGSLVVIEPIVLPEPPQPIDPPPSIAEPHPMPMPEQQ